MLGSERISNETSDGFNVGDVRFTVHLPHMPVMATTEDRIVILKPPHFLKKYDDVFARLPNRNVVEVGIAEGGSLIYFALTFPHLKFVGIDLRSPNQHVLNHIDRLGLGDRVSINYRVDQGDKRAVQSIISSAYGAERLGAVMDDASHFYAPSRATFESTFGWIAPGGVYCLEDWSWAHEPGRQESGVWSEQLSLVNLVFEIIMAQPSQSHLIGDIRIDRNVAFLTRGAAQKIPDFDLDKLVLNRGKKLIRV